MRKLVLSSLLSIALIAGAGAAPVINEIMFHPPGTLEDVGQEWLEIYNVPGTGVVYLTSWKLTNGVDFTFPAGTSIASGGYLVVAADVAKFQVAHPGVTNVVGGWLGTLSNNSNTIRLVDVVGTKISEVTYTSGGDWALRARSAVSLTHKGWEWICEADGGGKSLELRNPVLSLDSGQNWGSSTTVGGTPGAANLLANANIAPLIKDAKHKPEIPKSTEPVVVSCAVQDEIAGATATLYWRLDAGTWQALPMTDTNGDGDVEATIPAQANLAIVEWYISATDGTNTRTWPDLARTSDPGVTPQTFGQVTNALFQVDNTFDATATFLTAANNPLYRIVLTLAERNELVQLQTTSGQEHSDARFNGTFISHDGEGVKTRYRCAIGNRGQSTALGPPNNYHVGFTNQDTWNGRTTTGINSRFPYSQALGTALYTRAGVAPQDTAIVKVRLNGVDLAQAGATMYGRYARVEGRGSVWAKHHYPNDGDGNFYRLDYHYPGVDGVPAGNLALGEFRYEGETGTNYGDTFIKESNLDANDYTDLVGLCKIVSAPITGGTAGQPAIADSAYVAALSAVLDIDETFRFFATDALIGNMEGGLQSGGGDDASLYRGTIDTRFKFIPHDMDTIFDIGDTTGGVSRSMFSYDGGTSPGTGVLGLARLFSHPQLVPRYYAAMLNALNTWFTSATIDPIIDQTMTGWVPTTDGVSQNRSIPDIKAYVTARRTNMLAQIQQNYSLVTTTAGGTSTDGYKQTTDGVATFSGTFNVAKTYSITVNGVSAALNYRTTSTLTAGTWSLAVAAGGGGVLKPGLNEIVVRFWDAPGGTGNVVQTLAAIVFYNTGTTTQVSGTLTTTAADTIGLLAPASYVPGVPMTVRVDLKDAAGNLDRQAWTKTATLTASGGQTLTPSTVTLYNGMGSALVTVGGGSGGATTQLIQPGGTLAAPNASAPDWKMLDSGADPGTAWLALAFTDTTWKTGKLQAGAGDGDERTLLSNVPASSTNTRRGFYFREVFNVADPSVFTALQIKAVVDDGAIFYLNGTEVYRFHMPAGTPTVTTPASANSDNTTNPTESQIQTYDISAFRNLLVAGPNILAVEVHNYSLGSTYSPDLSFDCELDGIQAATNPGNFTLTAAVPGSTSAVKALTSLGGVAQTSVSGTLATGTTNWSGIIRVTGDVTVPAGGTLVIAPGTTVLLDGTVYTQGTAPDALGKKIIVNGTLSAVGTATQPITFTCSDALNRWGEISQAATGTVTLQYCLLSRACHSTGGGHTGTGPMLRVAGGTLLVEDSVLSDGPGKVLFNSGNPTITFRRTHCGRSVTGPEITGSTLTIEDSNFTEMLAAYRQSGAQDDEDNIYIHDSGGRPVNLRRSVFGIADDDALDCLAGDLTVDDCVLRDAFDKGISLLQNNATVRRSQIVDCDFGISLKTQIGDEATPYTVNVQSCSIVTATHATNTSDQTGGTSYHNVPIFTRNKYGTAANAQLFFNVKNSILSGITPVENDYGTVGSFPLTSITYTCYQKQAGTNPIDPTPPAQTGDITADPLFVDATAKNFKLQPASPCINSGNPAETDPDGSRIDMGALPSGSLATGGTVTWTAAGGPYYITANLTVPAGLTLVIQPGTSVQVAQNARITVKGKLLAQGTAAQHITFSHLAGTIAAGDADPIKVGTQTAAPKWGGLRIVDSMAAENIVSYCDFINAQGTSPVDLAETDQENWGGLGFIRSWGWADHCTWTGSHLRWCYGRCAKLTVSGCTFTDMFDPADTGSLTTSDSPPAGYISGADNKQEPLKVEYKSTDSVLTGNANFVQGFPVGGWFRVYYNDFYGNKGHNDVFDGDGGRVGVTYPLDCRYNYFHGLSGDEHMDLKGDALIANNIIERATKDKWTSDTGYSNAISTDGVGAGTTDMVARNLVFDVDHLINCKLDVAAFVEHNTIANLHADFQYTDSVYGINQAVKCSVVNMLVFNDAGGTPPHGDGAYLGFNVISGVPRLVSEADTVQTATNTINHSYTSKLEFNRNLCDAVTDTSIGFNHPGTIYASAFGTNLPGVPLFVDSANKNYALKQGSPAKGTGPAGLDLGFTIPEWAYIEAGPSLVTNSAAADFLIGGPGLIAYKWRLDGGAWSATIPIGNGAVFSRTVPTVRQAPLTLTGLAAGAHTLEVLGQDFAGNWQDADPAKTYTGQPQFTATARTWTVAPTQQLVRLNEILADSLTAPDAIELYNDGDTAVNLGGYTLTDSVALPAKYAFLAGTMIASKGFLTVTATQTAISLDRDGDGVFLYQAGALVDTVAFGHQLPDLSIGRIGRVGAWTLCTPTFGAANIATATGDPSVVKINEWFADGTVLYDNDWLELANPGTLPVALAGLTLTDNAVGLPGQHVIAPLTFIAPGGFVKFIADGNALAGPGHLAFTLDSQQESIALGTATGTQLDLIIFGPQTTDRSQGRDATGLYTYYELPTRELANGATDPAYLNALAILRSLRITEVMYNPLGGSDYEFVELRNVGATTLQLAGVSIVNGLAFTFPATSLAAGQNVLVVANLAKFRSRYGNLPNVAGTFIGKLDNSGETLAIQLPPPFDAYAMNFAYSDTWQPGTDGPGRSLIVGNTLLPASQWADRSTWLASTAIGGDPDGATLPLHGTYADWSAHFAAGLATADLDRDGIPALVEFALGLDPTAAALPASPGLPATAISADGHLELHLALPDSTLATQLHGQPEITYTVEATDDLVTWNVIATKSFTTPWTAPGTAAGTATITVGTSAAGRIPVTIQDPSSTPNRYLRLRAAWTP